MRLLVIASGRFSERYAKGIVIASLDFRYGSLDAWKFLRSLDKIVGEISDYQPDVLALVHPYASDIARAYNIVGNLPHRITLVHSPIVTTDDFELELKKFEAETRPEKRKRLSHRFN